MVNADLSDTCIPESLQRKMYGLFAVVTKGSAGAECPPDMIPEQYEVYKSYSDLSREQAMKEYVSLVDGLTLQSLMSEQVAAKPRTLAVKKSSRADPVSATTQSLHELCRDGNSAALQELLLKLLDSSGDDMSTAINAADEDGLTPLMLAVDSESVNCVSHLLAHGASCSPRDVEGQTVFHYVALVGSEQVAQLLVTGCDACEEILAFRGNDGQTALEWAVKEQNEGVVHVFTKAITPK